jgi:transposase-like protein
LRDPLRAGSAFASAGDRGTEARRRELLRRNALDDRLERLHGEIKRRTRAVGAFPDRASALRLVTAVPLNVTAIWTDRRYLDMKLLASTQQISKAA